jgi:gamma-glutamyltranspeptidase/glutathione hydrolase
VRIGSRIPEISLLVGLAACTAPPQAASPPFFRTDILERVPPEWRYPLATPPAVAAHGMVVTDAPLATRVGVRELEAGGNAVDAAIAATFALAVVYPEAGNLGGGGFMVVRMADGAVAALDFRETAPLAATRDMYLDENGELTDRSLTGHLASGVPGSVAGLWEAHQRFGSRPWAELLAPAIRLAEEGFIVDEAFANAVRAQAERLAQFPASAALFLPGGEPIRAGTRWRNPDLAAVLRRVAERGPAGFYEGETADLIVAEMQRGGGIITHEDLRRYRARWREPVIFDYRGYQVISMPPPSSGGITLALIANILEGYDLRRLGWHSPTTLHLTAEAMRRAFADRNHYLADPDFVEVPREMLLSKAYAARLRSSIALDRATPSSTIAHPIGGPASEGNHTTHLSVVDQHGNAVALTTTINELFGSAVTVAGAGFLLNNEMDDFSAKPGSPNLFGLVQGVANAIEPGKRPLSAMTPTIVTRDGRPILITGARGGPRIITAVFQVLSNILDHGMDVSAAVAAPRIHHQHLPDVLYYEENGLTADQLRVLEALGHTLEPRRGTVGHAPSILRRGGEWTAVPDPRLGGLAEGH